MNLKSILSITAATLLSASMSVMAQQTTVQNQPTGGGAFGKIHGHVTDPTGVPKGGGTVSVSTDGGHTSKLSFPVNEKGDYVGDNVPAGTYSVILKLADTPEGKFVDMLEDVKITNGADTVANIDMSRQAYIDKLNPDQKKQVEEFKKKNQEVTKTNELIKNLNGDLATVRSLIKEGDGAHAAAIAALGASATKPDIATKESEIKLAKYGEAETLMLKDTSAKPDAAILWNELGNAQAGLGKFTEAEAAYKKALETNAAGGKPKPELDGGAHDGLGMVYVRTKKVDEATTEIDAAVKAVPAQASLYYSNYAKVLYSMNSTGQLSNPDAQAAIADKAIAATPGTGQGTAILYYLKAQALTQKATFDEKTQKISLPPGTAEAYQKYLDLDPSGPFSEDAKQVLASAGQKVESKFKAKK
jgi:tetratricopeptide (TPR) repeat protein